MPDSVTLRDFSGNVVSVPEAQVQELLDRGYTPETSAQGLERTAEGVREDLYGGFGGALKAGVTGALSGLTLGASDVIGSALGARQALRGLQEENPATSIGANIAGAVIPAILTAGASTPGTAAGLGARILAKTPAAIASRAGLTAGEAVAAGGAGLGARVAAGATAAAVEGGLQGGGSYLSQVALEDKPLSAEGFVAGMGTGALFAAPIGGAFTAGERALVRARKLFPKSEVTDQAAKGIKQEAVSELTTAAAEGETMAALAARKLAASEAKVGMAEAGEQATRRLFGTADPQSLGDQVVAGTERQQLQDALRGYQASKAQFDDWLRTEADPDLEAALLGLQVPEVGLSGGRIEKLPGKFGEPELAVGTPVDRAPNQELLDALDMRARQVDSTRVGKRPGSAAPVELIEGVGGGGVSVPLMITQQMKSDLKRLGYSADEVFEMKPAEAWEAISAGPRTPIAIADSPATAVGKRPPLPSPLPSSANAGSSLEDLLAGTKQQLDAGKSLGEIGAAAPLRKAYVAGKELDTGRLLTQRPASNITDDEFDKISAGISRPEFDSVLQNVDDGSVLKINGQLRNGVGIDDLSEGERIALGNLDHAMDKAPLPQDAVLYRGVKNPAAIGIPDNLKIGDSYSDSGFSWVTHRSEIAKEYANQVGSKPGIILEIEAPKGFPAVPYRTSGGEPEILLPRGTQYTVTDIRDGGSVIRVAARRADDLARIPGHNEIRAIVKEAPGDMLKRVEANIDSMSIDDILRTQADILSARADMDAAARKLSKEVMESLDSRRLAIQDGIIPDRPAPRVSETPRPAPRNAKIKDRTSGDIPSYDAIRKHEAKTDDYLEQTLSARKIDEIGYYEPKAGGHTDEVRNKNARKAISEGQREAVKLTVTPSGKVTVVDGRHRLKAAIDANAPIKVKWSAGVEPAADDVFRGGAGGQFEFSVNHRSLGRVPIRLTTETANLGGGSITSVQAFRKSDGEDVFVGEARFTHQGGELLPDEVTVDGPFRRLGIGTKMYQAAERETGLKVIPGRRQTEMGKAFSEKYRGTRDGTPDAATASGLPPGLRRIDGAYEPKNGSGDPVRASSPEIRVEINKGETVKDLSSPGAGQFLRQRVHDVGFGPSDDATFLGDEPKKRWLGSLGIDWSVPANRDALMDLARSGEVQLSRADLISAFDYNMVKASEVADRGATFHFILDDGRKSANELAAAEGRALPFPAASRRAVSVDAPTAPAVPTTTAKVGAPATQGDDLTELLARTKQGLDSGQSLRDVSSGLPAETGLESIARMQRLANVPDDLGQQIVERELGPQVTRVLGKRSGSNVDMGPDLTRAAKAIGDHEAALAHLADVLGPDAPVTAVARAKAYRTAVEAQSDALSSSVAKAAQDLSERGPGTVVDDEIAKAIRQHEMRARPVPVDITQVDDGIARALRQADAPAADVTQVDSGITRAIRDSEMRSAPVVGAADPAARSSGLGRLADVGTALEVLQVMGVGVPDIGKIPVIGPILSTYFKARAVMGILGRKGGSIGRSADSIVASKAAAVRDRISTATGKILEGSAKVARGGARVAAPVGVVLSTKLFPGGDDPKSKDPQVLYEARADEISRALQPGAISRAVDDRILTADAQLQQAISGQVERGIRFLESKMPRQTVLPGMLPGDGDWKPSRAALEVWARYIKAVNDPVSVLEDLARGHVTVEGAETLRTVYPRLFQEAQRMLLEAAPKMQKTLPYARRRTISILYQVPIDSTMTPQHMQFLQSARQAGGVQNTPQPGAPAMTAPLQIGQQMMPPLDRRAGM